MICRQGLSPRRALSLVIPLAVGATIVYALTLMRAPGFDFRVFYAAAVALRDGANPYAPAQLVTHELHLYPTVLTTSIERGRLNQFPYVHSPLVLIGLLPLTHWTWATLYPWVCLAILLAIVAALVMTQLLWPLPTPVAAALFLLASPSVALNLYLGQFDALVLLALVVAIMAQKYGRDVISGFILAIVFVKPQLSLAPLLLLGVLAWRHSTLRHYLTGIALGLAANAAAILTIRPTLAMEWLHGLQLFAAGPVYLQEDMASLTTFYLGTIPAHLVDPIATIFSLLWLACLAFLWRRVRTQDAEDWWLLFGLASWLLVTPYAHSQDLLLIFPAVWYAWQAPSPSSDSTIRALRAALAIALWVLPLSYVYVGVPLDIGGTRGLSVIVLLLLVGLLWHLRPREVAQLDTRVWVTKT